MSEHWIAYMGEATIESNHVLDSQDEAEHYRNNGWTVEGPFIPATPESDEELRLREAIREARALLHTSPRPQAMAAVLVLGRALDTLREGD